MVQVNQFLYQAKGEMVSINYGQYSFRYLSKFLGKMKPVPYHATSGFDSGNRGQWGISPHLSPISSLQPHTGPEAKQSTSLKHYREGAGTCLPISRTWKTRTGLVFFCWWWEWKWYRQWVIMAQGFSLGVQLMGPRGILRGRAKHQQFPTCRLRGSTSRAKRNALDLSCPIQ